MSEELLQRLELLERRVLRLETTVDSFLSEGTKQVTPGGDGGGPPESEDVKARDVSDHIIKVVYAGVFNRVDNLRVGFPRNRKRMAFRVKVGTQVFLYVTTPIKAIIGLAEAVGGAFVSDNPNWPYEVPLRWVIRPRQKGVKFTEVGLDIRPRVGDTAYAISEAKALEIRRLLEERPELTPSQLEYLQGQFPEEAHAPLPGEEE